MTVAATDAGQLRRPSRRQANHRDAGAAASRPRAGATSSVCSALFFALFPVWFVLVAAFSESGTLERPERSCPESFTHEAVHSLVDNYPYWRWFVNSLFISLTATLFIVLLAASAAYAFSRLRFRGRRPGCLALLLIQMFPASLAFVAIYLMVQPARQHVPVARRPDRS